MSSLGKNFRITIFGASHGEAIGVVMEGLPVGFAIDMDALGAEISPAPCLIHGIFVINRHVVFQVTLT